MKFLKLLIFLFVLIGWSPNAIAFWGLADAGVKTYTVDTRPSVTANTNRAIIIVDGNTDIDCETTGGGTTRNVCISDGTNWVVAGDGTGAAGSVSTGGAPVANDFARFTNLDTIAGLDYTETKTALSLENVENTALSTGNAGTATALAADGDDCAAGSYPLGVDVNGKVADCTDATTEIESAIAATKIDALTVADDNTTLDVSITAHGLAPKLSNDAATWLDGTGAYSAPSAGEVGAEVADAAIVKSDEAEVITANWDFSTDGTSTLDDADIDPDLTLGLLKMTALAAEPTEVVGEIYRVNGGGAWDPLGRGGSTDYWVICTVAGASGEYVGLWTEAGEWIVGKMASQTPLADTAANFDNNFTGQYLYGGTFLSTTAGTAVLPAVAVGMNFTYIVQGANANVIDPDGTDTPDRFTLNSLDMASDENLESSTAGHSCVFQYYKADYWLATCYGFVEATP